jgi:hypothetical protein
LAAETIITMKRAFVENVVKNVVKKLISLLGTEL